MSFDLRYFSIHSSVLTLPQIVHLIPKSKCELSWYSKKTALLINVTVTTHIFLKSDGSVLNDEQLLLFLPIKIVLDKKGHDSQIFMENYKGEVTYSCQSTYCIFVIFFLERKVSNFMNTSEIEKHFRIMKYSRMIKYSRIMKYFRL